MRRLSASLLDYLNPATHAALLYSASEIDPLRSALGSDCMVDAVYEAALEKPFP